MESEYPAVVVAAKTRIAARRVLNDLEAEVMKLWQHGAVRVEQSEILELELDQMMHNLTKITPRNVLPDINTVLNQVYWLQDKDVLKNYFIEKGIVYRVPKGALLISPDQDTRGVYIVLEGVVELQYNPTAEHLKDLQEKGLLPTTADYRRSLTHSSIEFLGIGTVLGVLGVLTGRKSDNNVHCTKTAKVLFIHKETLRLAADFMSESSKYFIASTKDFRYKMWKSIAMKVATYVLKKQSVFDAYTVENLRLRVENSFLPNLSEDIPYEIDHGRYEVVIVYGRVYDPEGETYYPAPIILPLDVQSVIIKKDDLNEPDPKILLIYRQALMHEHLFAAAQVDRDVTMQFYKGRRTKASGAGLFANTKS